MTQKELLYFEDAIGHEENITKIVKEASSKLEDSDLISFMESELEVHENMHEKLINLLEEKANE